MKHHRFSQASLNRLATVDVALQDIAHRALELSPVDFGIPSSGGIRSALEQNKLFHDGKSKLDGYDKISKHQLGVALDVYAYVDGKASWNDADLTQVAAAMLQAASEQGIKLVWGGHWASFKDMPHFEMVD